MSSLTKVQLIILLSLGACNFLAGVVFSLQAPFFPAEAERQGASTTFAGIVLGIYELAGFIFCPIVAGTLLHWYGSFVCFHAGNFVLGSAIICFGFLNRVNNTLTFVILSVSLRILEAAGASTAFVSSYGFITVAFPESIGTAFAVMETSFAVGMAVGPPFGELLYTLAMGAENWSYTTPFMTMGFVIYTTITITSTTTLRALKPMIKEKTENHKVNPDSRKEGFLAFIRIPNVVIFYMTVMSGALCCGFLTCTLEPHLRQFGLSPLQTGGMFLIFGGVYSCTAFIWGMICDRVSRPVFIIVLGCVMTLIAFSLIGPIYGFRLKPSLALTGVGLAMFGLSMGAIFVSAFILMQNEIKLQGFPDTLTLSSSVSALWLSGMHLGAFIGPILGGVLYDHAGFPAESLFAAVLFLTIISLYVIVLSRRPSSESARQEVTLIEEPFPTEDISEKTPLLISQIQRIPN